MMISIRWAWIASRKLTTESQSHRGRLPILPTGPIPIFVGVIRVRKMKRKLFSVSL
jgi:hypothetical protein